MRSALTTVAVAISCSAAIAVMDGSAHGRRAAGSLAWGMSRPHEQFLERFTATQLVDRVSQQIRDRFRLRRQPWRGGREACSGRDAVGDHHAAQRTTGPSGLRSVRPSVAAKATSTNHKITAVNTAPATALVLARPSPPPPAVRSGGSSTPARWSLPHVDIAGQRGAEQG
jgi:hypothetical protein